MQDERKLVPTIFDRDATDNDLVVNVAKATCNVNNIVGAQHNNLTITEASHVCCCILMYYMWPHVSWACQLSVGWFDNQLWPGTK